MSNRSRRVAHAVAAAALLLCAAAAQASGGAEADTASGEVVVLATMDRGTALGARRAAAPLSSTGRP